MYHHHGVARNCSHSEIFRCCCCCCLCCCCLCCCFVLLCVVVCCCAQPLKTQTLNLAWESGPALRAPLVLGLALLWLWLLWLLLVDFPGPPSAGPPSTGPPPPDRPNISLFFFPFPPPFRSFCVSLGVFSLNFGVVFEFRNPKMCTFGLSGCRVKPRRPHQTGPPGLAHDSPRTPNVHISGPLRFKTPPKFHEKTPKRHRKSETVAGKGRKSAKFWAPHHLRSGPHPFGAPPFRGPTLRGRFGQSRPIKVGHSRFGQNRSIKVGQSRSNFFWPKSVWPKSELAKVGQ